MSAVAASVPAVLEELVGRRLEPRAREWFARARAADPATFLDDFTATARRLGKGPLGLAPDERARLLDARVDWPLDGWGRDELGRVALIVRAASRWATSALRDALETAYRQGDNRERQAVLRALPFLPAPEPFLTLGVDACRTHVQPVFEAIACENPYPARQFPELNFNQMVLKALFTGVALERIVGLTPRITPDLMRMANDFASERRAAGRPVPPDIWRLTGAQRSEP